MRLALAVEGSQGCRKYIHGASTSTVNILGKENKGILGTQIGANAWVYYRGDFSKIATSGTSVPRDKFLGVSALITPLNRPLECVYIVKDIESSSVGVHVHNKVIRVLTVTSTLQFTNILYIFFIIILLYYYYHYYIPVTLARSP